MKIFQRKQSLAQAFKLPLWGCAAEEVPPKWLVTRVQNGDLAINSLGGFDAVAAFGRLSCAAGDIVVLHDDDTIEFVKADAFEAGYQPLDPNEILKAA